MEETLNSRGPVLPIGIADESGVFARDLAFKRWTGATMRELGKKRNAGRELTMSEHIGLILAILATKLGPYDFCELPRDKQKLILSNMYLGDVFYAYAYARLEALGPDIDIDMVCPVCLEQFRFTGDLGEVSVKPIEKIEDSFWTYELEDPIIIRGKEVKEFSMCQAKWHSVETVRSVGKFDAEAGKLAMIRGVIRGVKGREEFPLTEAEIDELSGRDIENIIGLTEEHYFGPDMKISTRCVKDGCGALIENPINWSYGNFFCQSSRSRTSKRSTTSSSGPHTSQTEG